MPVRQHLRRTRSARHRDISCPSATPHACAIPRACARLVAALALLATLPACLPAKDRTAPDEIVGVWTTSEPRYADRFFEITRDSITIGTGQGHRQTHLIIAIERAREDKTILYTLSYESADGEGEDGLSFYYDATAEGVIRFKNQEQIPWRKKRP